MWHVPMSAMEATQSNNDQRKLGENEECLELPLAGANHQDQLETYQCHNRQFKLWWSVGSNA